MAATWFCTVSMLAIFQITTWVQNSSIITCPSCSRKHHKFWGISADSDGGHSFHNQNSGHLAWIIPIGGYHSDYRMSDSGSSWYWSCGHEPPLCACQWWNTQVESNFKHTLIYVINPCLDHVTCIRVRRTLLSIFALIHMFFAEIGSWPSLLA